MEPCARSRSLGAAFGAVARAITWASFRSITSYAWVSTSQSSSDSVRASAVSVRSSRGIGELFSAFLVRGCARVQQQCTSGVAELQRDKNKLRFEALALSA